MAEAINKKNSLWVPVVIVLLIVLLLGTIGLGVYYYMAGVKNAQDAIENTKTEEPKSIEEQQLESAQQDLDSTKDFDTTGVDADAAEIERIDISGAL